MIKFVANIAMLFTEYPILQRFDAAAKAGFRVVEIWSPTEVDPQDIRRAKEAAGVELLQFNADAGDFFGGEMGLLSLPDRRAQFRSSFEAELGYAGLLGTRQFNCLLGNRSPAYTVEAQLACARENLEWVHPLLEERDLYLNIELLSPAVAPHYLLTSSRELFSLLRELDLPRVGAQHDLFHMQLLEGNLVTTMRENLPHIGHVQIADAPGRNQPGTGEINYRYVLGQIEAMGYDRFVSLEYKPLGSTKESLTWLPVECRVQARALDLML
jgi:hydroxypyruvate isomerase